MRIGVDLGGTKIEAIALGDAGDELFRRRVQTPQGDYQGTVAAIAELVTVLERELEATGTVGVGMPGTISAATGLVKNANSVCLNGQPLDKDLEAALARPVRLANDANCFALSEATDGAAAGAEVVFGVILGSGVGGGLVVRGEVLTGPNSIAGEWGHNPLPWPKPEELPGRECYCGHRGCLETFLNGSALDEINKALGSPVSTALLGPRAAASQPVENLVLDQYEHRLARALASVINVIDPDVIVLGGGMSNIDRFYEGVPTRWGDFVFSDHVATELRKAQHGDSSGVRGAAWLWPRSAT